jgi:hypothetical protein
MSTSPSFDCFYGPGTSRIRMNSSMQILACFYPARWLCFIQRLAVLLLPNQDIALNYLYGRVTLLRKLLSSKKIVARWKIRLMLRTTVRPSSRDVTSARFIYTYVLHESPRTLSSKKICAMAWEDFRSRSNGPGLYAIVRQSTLCSETQVLHRIGAPIYILFVVFTPKC